MEELNKQQVVLLCVLVSFVTAIATGITTVSLLGDAPQGTIVQTINRVVEQTVDTVVPSEEGEEDEEQQQQTITYSEASAHAAEKARGTIVQIKSEDGTVIANGILISASEVLAPAVSGASQVTLGDKTVSLSLNEERSNERISIYSVSESIGEPSTGWSDVSKLKLGQGVIYFADEGNAAINQGIISSLVPTSLGTQVHASVNANGPPGSVLVGLDGSIVGILIQGDGGVYEFYGADSVTTS